MGDSSNRWIRPISQGSHDPRSLRGKGSPPPRERRRTDRRGVGGRRTADQDFACYGAPFVAHCLNQFNGETKELAGFEESAARLAYRQAKRRRP